MRKQISRRQFVHLLGMGVLAASLPLNACRKLAQPGAYAWTEHENLTLKATLEHLWPANGDIPGTEDTNTLGHLQKVLKDPFLRNAYRKVLRSGPKWTEELSKEVFQQSFTVLSSEQKEHVLRKLEEKKNGGRFLNYILRYHFEALLGDPAYGINSEKKGWKWLGHIPGYPRPETSQIYPHYE